MTHFPAVRRALFAVLALLGLSATARSAAVISHTINYQGFLTDTATGLPIDTGKDMQFTIYSAATGGSALFAESRCAVTNSRVSVSKGRYQVELGSTTTGGIPASVFNGNANAWLEVRVDPNNDCLAMETLSPRVRLQSAPYAFQTAYAATATAVVGGYADIGTGLPSNPPQEPLRVFHRSNPSNAQNMIKFRRESDSGISANGMGARVFFEMPNDSGTDQQVAAVSAVMTDVVAGQEKGALTFETLDGSGGGPFEWMRIDDTGDVGIGTTDPQSRLHVNNGDIRLSTTAGSSGYYFQDSTLQTTAARQGAVTGAAGAFAVGPAAGCAGAGTEIAGPGAPVAMLTRSYSNNRVLMQGYLNLVNAGAAQSFCVDLCAGTGGIAACPCPGGGNPGSVAYTSAYIGAGVWGGVAMNALINPVALAFPPGVPIDAWFCVGHSAVGAVGAPVVNGSIILQDMAP